VKSLDRPFWAVCLTVAIIGTITWVAIFEHNFHPRIYTYGEDVTSDHARALEIVG